MSNPVSDEFLERRVKTLHNRLASNQLAARGLKATAERLKLSLRSTVSVVETVVGGKPVRIITTTDTAFYKMLKESPHTLLLPSEILGSRPAHAYGPKEPKKRSPRQAIHAEQLGVNDAKKMGATSGRIATSNPGCTNQCISLLSDEFPTFRHVNPVSAAPDPNLGSAVPNAPAPHTHAAPAAGTSSTPETTTHKPSVADRGVSRRGVDAGTPQRVERADVPVRSEPAPPKPRASTAAHVAEGSVNAAERSSRLRSLKIGLKAWRAARVVGKVLFTCFVPLKALDIVLEIAMAIWDHERAKEEQKEQEKQRTLEAVFKQGASTIKKGIQAIVSSGATVQGFMDAWERSTRHTGFHYARLRAVVEVQSFRGLSSGRIETIDSMTTYRLVSLNVKATSAFHDFEIEEHGEEKEVEKTDREKVALYLKGHSSSDLFRKTLRNRSLGYTIVPPLHTPFDVAVTKINNLFVDVTTVITGITGSADAWLDGFQSFNFARGWKEQFDLEPQFTAPLNPPVCEFCLSYLFASAKVLSRHPLEPQDVEGNLEDPRKGYGRRFDLLATRVDHDRAPYDKNFSDFVGQIGKLVKSGRADADMAAAVEKLQVGARSIWNDLRRIEDNIKNPEYYYLGPNYKPAR